MRRDAENTDEKLLITGPAPQTTPTQTKWPVNTESERITEYTCH